MPSRQTGRSSDQFNLRLPEGMREKIASEAAKSGRSMNSEIVHRLANSLDNGAFEDAGLSGLDEDLNFNLMHAAHYSGRSLHDEMVFRLESTFNNSVLEDLERKLFQSSHKTAVLERLFLQLTPEERLTLEERADIIENIKLYGYKPKDIGKLCQLRKIGGNGRINLRITRPGAEFILNEEQLQGTPKDS